MYNHLLHIEVGCIGTKYPSEILNQDLNQCRDLKNCEIKLQLVLKFGYFTSLL